MSAITSGSNFDTQVLGGLQDMRAALKRQSKLKGLQPDDTSLQEVRSMIGPEPAGGYRRDLLIEYLHGINDSVGALRERHLVALASAMKLAMAEVFEVASFYHHFDIVGDEDKISPCVVRVCDGLSCELAGARTLFDQVVQRLQDDGVRVIKAPCIGRCEQAPAVLVRQRAVQCATVADVCAEASLATPEPEPPETVRFEHYKEQGGYQVLKRLMNLELSPQAVLSTMEDSGLRGLGGAGFPAGRKWRIVSSQPAPRLMAVNIDEGEPGTFKDRYYLERDPHRFLEGMFIAANVVGIDAIYIYLRDEYHAARGVLQRALAEVDRHFKGQLPAVELRRGAGAYICGEESAMIESIEGKRGEPRMRPPYIAEVGLFGRPTLEHNFETLYWVRDLVERGAVWFSGAGRHGRRGWRSFSVSGRVQVPGVKWAPAGITLRQLIDEFCGGMQEGHQLYGYLPGGASGGILPARLADVPLDFDTLQPHGCFIGSAAVIVLSQSDKARDAALNMMRFFAHESCGQCTPCRVGTSKAAQLMEAVRWDETVLQDLSEVMGDASICGLGQAAPNPIRCVMKYFGHEIKGAASEP